MKCLKKPLNLAEMKFLKRIIFILTDVINYLEFYFNK